MYYYHNAYAMNQYLASQGYVVLSVNYRMGIMYGRAFREAPNTSWRGAAEYKDVVAGAKYLQTLPTVDPKKIGLWGGWYRGISYGFGSGAQFRSFSRPESISHGVHDWSVFSNPSVCSCAPFTSLLWDCCSARWQNSKSNCARRSP